MTVDVVVTAHHEETPLSTASNTAIAGNGIPFTFVPVTLVLGQRHFIHGCFGQFTCQLQRKLTLWTSIT